MVKRRKADAPPQGLLEQPWELAASGISIQAGPIRIRFEAAGTREEREALARAIVSLPTLLAASQKAWAILVALDPDPPTRRVRDDLAAIMGQIRGGA